MKKKLPLICYIQVNCKIRRKKNLTRYERLETGEKVPGTVYAVFVESTSLDS